MSWQHGWALRVSASLASEVSRPVGCGWLCWSWLGSVAVGSVSCGCWSCKQASSGLFLRQRQGSEREHRSTHGRLKPAQSWQLSLQPRSLGLSNSQGQGREKWTQPFDGRSCKVTYPGCEYSKGCRIGATVAVCFNRCSPSTRVKTGAFRNITISCFFSTLHSFLESWSSQHIAKATFSKTWWSSSKTKHSSSSYMTKMARGRARMCSRTYRGRWPSGFSQSTCHLPKVLLYETSSPKNVPRGLASSAAALASHEHTSLTWRPFLAGPRSCFYCLSCSWISRCSSHELLLRNKGHATGPQVRLQLDPELEGQRGAAELTSSESTPGAVEHPLPGTAVQQIDWELKVVQVPGWQLENFTAPTLKSIIFITHYLSSCNSARVKPW